MNCKHVREVNLYHRIVLSADYLQFKQIISEFQILFICLIVIFFAVVAAFDVVVGFVVACSQIYSNLFLFIFLSSSEFFFHFSHIFHQFHFDSCLPQLQQSIQKNTSIHILFQFTNLSLPRDSLSLLGRCLYFLLCLSLDSLAIGSQLMPQSLN